MSLIQQIKENINTNIEIKEKRPYIYQIYAPFYHEDGDMVEIFVEESNGKLKICDYGLTLMKLSYYLDDLKGTNKKVYHEILKENYLDEIDGNIFIETDLKNLSTNFLHYASSISKVSSLKYFDKHKQKSMFYDILFQFIENKFQDLNPKKDIAPLEKMPDNKVDFVFESDKKPIYLFGVKNELQALKVITSCLEFKQEKLKYKSIVVYEDFEKNLSGNTRLKLIRNTDKQFVNLPQFYEEGHDYIQSEVA